MSYLVVFAGAGIGGGLRHGVGAWMAIRIPAMTARASGNAALFMGILSVAAGGRMPRRPGSEQGQLRFARCFRDGESSGFGSGFKWPSRFSGAMIHKVTTVATLRTMATS